MLRQICKEKTLLDERDILTLEDLERQLPLIAELTQADVFIDCLISDRQAVVAAQARPASAESIYEKTVVGEDALAEKEPAVFHAARIGAPVRDIKAVTQENRAVRQSVVPIRGWAGYVVAVLIQETDISRDLRREKKLEALSKSYEEAAPSLRSERVESSEVTTLREVHHRIKNSLQLVASILNLQARKYRGSEVEKILTENVGRVLSIAAIHDILTQDQGRFDRVSGLSILNKLGSGLRTFVPEGKDIQIEVGGDDVVVSASQASSVALVVNELITNALEHAFETTDHGHIRVSFCKGTLFHTVTVTDDGAGFPPEADRGERMGLRIVEATVRDKLRGQLHVHSDSSGTQVSFDIKNEIV